MTMTITRTTTPAGTGTGTRSRPRPRETTGMIGLYVRRHVPYVPNHGAIHIRIRIAIFVRISVRIPVFWLVDDGRCFLLLSLLLLLLLVLFLLVFWYCCVGIIRLVILRVCVIVLVLVLVLVFGIIAMTMMYVSRQPTGRLFLCFLFATTMLRMLTMIIIERDYEMVVGAISTLAWFWPSTLGLLLLLLLLCGRLGLMLPIDWVLILTILILIRIRVLVLILILVHLGVPPRLYIGVFPTRSRFQLRLFLFGFRSGSTTTAGWIWVLSLPLSLSIPIVVIKEILIRTPDEIATRFCRGFIIMPDLIIIIMALLFSPIAFLRKLHAEPVRSYVNFTRKIVRVDVAAECDGVVSCISLLF